MHATEQIALGIDVGAECVKTIVLDGERTVRGRSVVPTRGRFQDCIHASKRAALDDAALAPDVPTRIGVTGFGAKAVAEADLRVSETVSHGASVFRRIGGGVTAVDIGGREPNVIWIDEDGRPRDSRTTRRCAIGIGTFLMFAARHLDVHPTRLEELAAGAGEPAQIGSYCSVFAGSEILERLLEGSTPGEIALGCIRSVAERVFEIGVFRSPVVVTGGVPEYFPGVVTALAAMIGAEVRVMPEPIMTGAHGAALRALRSVGPREAAGHGA